MRLIDADYAKDALSYIPWINPKETDDCIDKCPTVDAEPVRHGRWKMRIGYAVDYACSACKCRLPFGLDTNTKYCPSCGAKMDLGAGATESEIATPGAAWLAMTRKTVE